MSEMLKQNSLFLSFLPPLNSLNPPDSLSAICDRDMMIGTHTYVRYNLHVPFSLLCPVDLLGTVGHPNITDDGGHR